MFIEDSFPTQKIKINKKMKCTHSIDIKEKFFFITFSNDKENVAVISNYGISFHRKYFFVWSKIVVFRVGATVVK